ncbi:hypothetical protein M514_02869 [Trichuris suis]|uniref:Uncharacterized protein n=1 Tax=Trichuris suis TaxID=68888 RepID=A0A085NAX3_9BILA|nr:hypothetical protein M513_02869 [Trichuris suis]KFD66619.1 hypothetical protein M514_02869 [Trichuris suis]
MIFPYEFSETTIPFLFEDIVHQERFYFSTNGGTETATLRKAGKSYEEERKTHTPRQSTVIRRAGSNALFFVSKSFIDDFSLFRFSLIRDFAEGMTYA